uniref:Uncharacterized protein n=1 Tax=Nelumbo nucifera TaxID=4432 RepID=A0A822YBA5_NELNU|nr:TPA_asm: hypothetical protein HUJ06_029814 [Nelumbo nucifera]
MCLSKRCILLLLALLIVATAHTSRGVESRPLSVKDQQRYTKMFASLGLECKCCDKAGGECRSTESTTSSCPKLQCLPWRLY